jgi:hypothetical protein
LFEARRKQRQPFGVHCDGRIAPENVSLAFLRACRRVKIADFRLHDLRHTCASWMRMQGADIHVVALQLGHKDLRMAARYQHLAPAYLQQAVCGLDGVFKPELAPESGNATVTPEPVFPCTVRTLLPDNPPAISAAND